jgi:hypothetical protein
MKNPFVGNRFNIGAVKFCSVVGFCENFWKGGSSMINETIGMIFIYIGVLFDFLGVLGLFECRIFTTDFKLQQNV